MDRFELLVPQEAPRSPLSDGGFAAIFLDDGAELRAIECWSGGIRSADKNLDIFFGIPNSLRIWGLARSPFCSFLAWARTVVTWGHGKNEQITIPVAEFG